MQANFWNDANIVRNTEMGQFETALLCIFNQNTSVAVTTTDNSIEYNEASFLAYLSPGNLEAHNDNYEYNNVSNNALITYFAYNSIGHIYNSKFYYNFATFGIL